MKVVWICHFSNAEIQSILHPGISSNEFASWITHLAELFEKENRIELHIVAPHNHISKRMHFVIRNIHYHLFNPHIFLFGKKITGIGKLDYKTNFIYIKYLVRRIVDCIKPDLIHLHGTENAYYSSSILQFKNKYPVMITIQGFISHASNKIDYSTAKRINVEQRILKNFKHFGYRTKTMGKDIKKYNPEAELHWHRYPTVDIKPIETSKKYDIVFFARISKDKGIEDLLQALAIIKKAKHDVRLCIIGKGGSPYIAVLKKMADQLDISNNIYWAGFLPTQMEVHKMASAAKISILPTYHEIISGTIVESMFLKLPVVAYDVGSIHEVNDKEEYIYLVPKGDVNALAKKIMYLLQNPEKLAQIGGKAHIRATEMFDNRSICNDLIKAYNLVINVFKKI